MLVTNATEVIKTGTDPGGAAAQDGVHVPGVSSPCRGRINLSRLLAVAILLVSIMALQIPRQYTCKDDTT